MRLWELRRRARGAMKPEGSSFSCVVLRAIMTCPSGNPSMPACSGPPTVDTTASSTALFPILLGCSLSE